VVGRLRARLDCSASREIPAHVTVLYPFVPPRQITAAVIEMAAAVVKSVPGLGARFASTRWFGEDVLWLASEPAAPFRGAHRRRARGLPAVSAFGGAFAHVIPHLTVGDRPDGGMSALRAAQAQVLPMLPVRTHVSRAWLMSGTQAPGSWQRLAAVPLGQLLSAA